MASSETKRAATDTPETAGHVRAEQVRLLFRSPLQPLMNVFVTAMTCAVLWNHYPRTPLLAWAGIMIAVSLPRVVLWHRYRRNRPTFERAGAWGLAFTLGAGATGCLWGAAASVVWVVDALPYHVFMAFVAAGMSAGAIVANAAYLPAAYAFVIPAVSTLAVALFLQGTPIHSAMGTMVAVFLVVMAWIARNLNKSFAETFILQARNAALIAELSAGRSALENRVREQTAELVESEERYRRLVENSPVGILVNLDGKVAFANPAAVRMFGAESTETLIGRTVIDLIHPDFHEAVRRRSTGLLEQGNIPPPMEQVYVGLDGREITVEATATPIRFAGRKAILSVFRDLSEYKRTERALRESEGLLRALLDHSPAEIYLKDIEGRHILINREMERLYGRPGESLLFKTAHDLFPAEEADVHVAHDQAVREARRAITREYKIESETGPRVFQSVKFPIFDQDGGVRTIGAITTDITEQKATDEALRESEERLRQAQKMEAVGQLTGGVAHDFNNLLAIIMSNAEVLQTRLGPDDKLTQALIRAAQRGSELTQRLLAFSRRQSLDPRPVDLDAHVVGMLDLLRRTLGATIEILVRSGDGLWPALADPGQVENALLNLVLNARDAMPQGGRLTLETSNVSFDKTAAAAIGDLAPGDYVMLSVSDSGEGMSPETVEHAFEPFFTTKGVGQGSGLGLSMVYGFAKQSDGHVAIDSQAGKGTTVSLYLPRALAGVLASRPDWERAAPEGRGETVLVVEDEPEVLDLTATLLEGLGYDVVKAPDGSAALAALDGPSRVDLLLSDVVLPGGLAGPDLAGQIKERRPGIKVLFMSAYPDQAVRGNDIASHGAELLAKPFRKKDLAQKVRAALER